ncbi:senecionine N-oxygenase-like [Vanessa cardui]|uniref:senecionine N-oxygenase-like n=1 Tax=Vanessa cardui TaxID=171605 RepID=UPI001F148D01|nr:senecionine N-oxygenase-like [Vanessa cardui]
MAYVSRFFRLRKCVRTILKRVNMSNQACSPKVTHISDPRVCVIGAGIAGLASARYLKEEGIKFVVLESTRYVGGTWRYDSRVGYDENGLPLHTSMYMNLRTNLPKPTMELKDFPLPDDLPAFPSWRDYYKYIKDYAKHFDLERVIKFLHNVTLVSRVNDIWKVKYQNVVTGEEFEDEFDFVIVGAGHFSKPNMPNIPGEEKFSGSIIHSHDYREPFPYEGRRVLVIGAGPSGMEIVIDVANGAKTLFHSHHSEFSTVLPKHCISKPDVQEFNETGAIFKDGSYEDLDDVIYCTGFQYYYPYLDKSCGLNITPQSVTPLYRYMVNIYQPTLFMMGFVVKACQVVTLDAQARYATALIKGNFTLPSTEVMLEEWQKRADIVISRGRPFSEIHFLAETEDEYYADLTKESGIDRVPPVMFKIRSLSIEAMEDNLYTYRNYAYTVIDDENFVRTLDDKIVNNNGNNL